MAFHTQSPTTSQSPSPASSTHPSPHIGTAPLDNVYDDDSPQSEGTPNQFLSSLPRTQSAGKGGCWTCRVRRKKCDEIREDGSCKTCKRLTIQCLGWGAKRPDWMRDKKNVDAYKASIKAQLSRAGLIRGQPRQHPLPVSAQRSLSTGRQTNGTRATKSSDLQPYVTRTVDSPQPPAGPPRVVTSVPSESTPSPFDPLSAATYDPFDSAASFHYQAALSTGGTASYTASLIPDLLGDPSFTIFSTPSETFFDPTGPANSTTTAAHSELVLHYFSHVHRLQFIFANDLLTDITYNATVSEPHGAVSLAICALADLHSKQERISQGLELPSLVPENSSSNYLVHEALLKLESNKNTNRLWSESDALAAIYLVRLSQLSGGGCDWEHPFGILCQWLMQTNLHIPENAWTAFLNLSAISQLLAKITLWLDVFASLSTLRPPKFLPVLQRLLAEQQNFWANGGDHDAPHRLRMDLLTGCPDEAILAIAEVSNLAHWKASQLRNGCLSYPELIRMGTAIDQRLRRAPSDTSRGQDRVVANTSGPTREQRQLIANIFRETARLYLHTVLSNSAPAVPEINSAVDTIVRLFSQLPSSDVDRTLVFPICFAGCMTNDSVRRDFLKARIRSLDETYGNLLQTRRLMEAVWQKRDVGNKEVDIRETIQEQNLALLLI